MFRSTRALWQTAIVLSLATISGCNQVPGNGWPSSERAASTTGFIGEDGGQLELPNVASVTVEPGVLESTRAFVISKLAESGLPIGEDVTVLTIVSVTGTQERFAAPIELEFDFDPLLPEWVEPDRVVLLHAGDDGWVPAKEWEVDVALGVVRTHTRHLSQWAVVAAPRGTRKHAVTANVSPTFVPGVLGSDVTEDITITAKIIGPPDDPIDQDDIRFHMEFHSLHRDWAEASRTITWDSTAFPWDNLVPSPQVRATLEDLETVWRRTVTGIEYAGGGEVASASLSLDAELLTRLRGPDVAVYRIDVWITAGDWPHVGKSTVFPVYLFSPQYLPTVARAQNKVYWAGSPPTQLAWTYDRVQYDLADEFQDLADIERFTVLISDEDDPYTHPRWCLSNSGARRPDPSEGSFDSVEFTRISKGPDDSSTSWSCALPYEIIADLEPGAFTWTVITESPTRISDKMRANVLRWISFPQERLLPSDQQDPTRVSDNDSNGEHDFQSPVFRVTLIEQDPGDGPCGSDAECDDINACTVDICGAGICLHDAVECETDQLCDPESGECVECLARADCGEGQVCVDGRCVASTGDVPGAVPPGNPPTLTLQLGGGITLELVLIPAGSFMMGSAAGYTDELPVHSVTITNEFYMGRYAVTQEQWQQVMGDNPAYFTGAGDRPVEWVWWDDSVSFCQSVTVSTSRHVRLPTEAEWEYACRATTTTDFYFGDDNADLDNYAWFIANSGNETHPVGDKSPNIWGLYDMHGNVWEWCSDWYSSTYYGVSPLADPTGPDSGTSHVIRSGAWDRGNSIRSAMRGRASPGIRYNGLGLRVVVDP